MKITSPTNNQNISTGQLTIAGTSTDTAASECQVYVDWNDKKPFQRVVATGSEGSGDYSRWNYTYTATYHESEQNEDERQGPLYEDKDSIDSILEVIRDRDNHEDDDRTENEDSGIDPFIDIPFEVSIPRLSSIPSLPTPDLDDLEHVKGDDYNCDIVDAGFPFCDVREDK